MDILGKYCYYEYNVTIVFDDLNEITVRLLGLIGVFRNQGVHDVANRHLPRPNLIGPLIPIGEHTGHAGPPDGGKSLLPHEHSFINCEPIFRGNLLHLEIGILTPVGMFMIWICLILFCDGDYGIQKWIVMMVMMMMMMMIVNRKDSRIS